MKMRDSISPYLCLIMFTGLILAGMNTQVSAQEEIHDTLAKAMGFYHDAEFEEGLKVKTLVSEEHGAQGMIEYIPGEF